MPTRINFLQAASSMAILACLVVPAPAQQFPTEVPDSIAFTALYHVVYDAPPPHWNRETCQTWLTERGLDSLQAQKVMFAANRYMKKHAAIESELQTLNSETRNSLNSGTQVRRNQIESRRSAELAESVQLLRQEFGPDGVPKLDELIQKVKNGITMKRSGAK
jgi:hypothetical protein